ncbi:MAG TPA: hemerythrin domain-containing protein [bacterium]|nr:hemerythrin domain-containing protein [bacterium]
MDPISSFTLLDLNQVHREFEALFFQHQSALLERNPQEAQRLILEYERVLLLHTQEEEEILLPVYREKGDLLRGGDPDLFLAEHKKLREWLSRLKIRVHRLCNFDPGTKALLALLDDEAYFKKYMEHHTLREDRILYPELERVVPEGQKPHLLRLLSVSLRDMADP